MDPSFIFSVIFLSSFIRILVVLAILRRGIGFADLPSAISVIVISVALSFAGRLEISPDSLAYISRGRGTDLDNGHSAREIIHVLSARIDPMVINQIQGLSAKPNSSGLSDTTRDKAPSVELLLGAFAISEVRRAFAVGVKLLIPFFVIDLIVALFISMVGIHSITADSVSFPAKMLTFFAIDGWSLLLKTLFGQ